MTSNPDIYQEAHQAWDAWLASFGDGPIDRDALDACREGFNYGYCAAAEPRDQRTRELEEEGTAVVRLLQDIDTAGGFVTELAIELSDRIDAVLEGE